jgi:diaminopimelate epimerase
MDDNGLVKVNMGPPFLKVSEIPTSLEATNASGHCINARVIVCENNYEVTTVSMGNPHAVVFIDDICQFGVAMFTCIGPALSNHVVFSSGANAEFVEVDLESIIIIITIIDSALTDLIIL